MTVGVEDRVETQLLDERVYKEPAPPADVREMHGTAEWGRPAPVTRPHEHSFSMNALTGKNGKHRLP